MSDTAIAGSSGEQSRPQATTEPKPNFFTQWKKRIAEWWRALWHSRATTAQATHPGSAKSAAAHDSSCAHKRTIWTVGAGLFVLALVNHWVAPGAGGSLWRVGIGIATFLYCWWLAALLFDLVFIWHRYIQADAALQFLRTQVQPESFDPKYDPSVEEIAPHCHTPTIPPSTQKK